MSLEGMAPKVLAKEYKAVAKAMKSKDDAVRLSALERFRGDTRYLTAGGCLVPLLEAVAPKKKNLEFSKTALDGLLHFVDAKPVAPQQPLPALQGLGALYESEGHLGVLEVLSNLLVYKDEVKKVKEVKVKVKKGEPVPEYVPPPIVPDSELSVELRASALKAVYGFAESLKFLPAYMPKETVLALKKSFARIPGLASNLSSVILGVRGNPGGEDSASLRERLASEDAAAAATAAQDGANALASLVLVVRYNPDEALKVLMASGMLGSDVFPSLASHEFLSFHCAQLLDVLSQNVDGLQQFVLKPTTFSLLLTMTEAAAAAAAASGSRERIAELLTEVKTFTLIADRAGLSLHGNTVPSLVTAVSAAMLNSSVWSVCQAVPEKPFEAPLSDLVNSCCIMLGSLGKVNALVRTEAYQAGGAVTLLSVLQQSTAICGTPQAALSSEGEMPIPDPEVERTIRVNNLRRVAEQALLFLLTERIPSTSEPLLAPRWLPCAQFATDESLFGAEAAAATPFPTGALLALVGTENDDDLNNRGVRVLAALLHSSRDSTALMGELDVGSAGAAKVSVVVQARVKTVLELLSSTHQIADSQPEETEQQAATSPDPAPASVTKKDVLVCEPIEALFHALCVLESVLQQSAELVNVFATTEQISALATLLYRTGPTVASGVNSPCDEVTASLMDPRLVTWLPAEESDSTDSATAFVSQLRPLVLDVLTVVAGADALYRTYDGEVPPPAGTPLPAVTSPSLEQSLSVCKLCSNVITAILQCAAQFALSDGIVVSCPAAIDQTAAPLSVLVLNASLRLFQSFSSCGEAGALASLQALADAGLTETAAQGAGVYALRTFLMQSAWPSPEPPIPVAVNEGEEASPEPVNTVAPGSLPEGFVYAAPSSFADTVDYFDSAAVPTCARLLSTPSLWPLVSLCAPLVGILADPRNPPETAAYAAAAVGALCKTPLLADAAQPVVIDALCAILLSLGGGVALLGACGAFGNIPAASKNSAQALAAFLLSRGVVRETFWAEHLASESAEGQVVPGSDPSSGPSPTFWTTLLQVVTNDLHGRSPRATVLTTAAQGILPSLAADLVGQGADVNRPDAAGMSPMMYSLVLGLESVVEALVGSGKCNLDSVDAEGNPTLTYAFLTLRQEDVQATFCGPCSLGEDPAPAVLLGGASLAPLLVAAKVDLLVADAKGNSPLLQALGLASRELYLGGYRVTITSSAYSPQCPLGDTVFTADLLLQAGVAVNFCNLCCQAPLHLAAARGHVELIDLLLRKGAWPNALDAQGYLPLHYLAAACPEQAVQSAERLLAGCSDHPLKRLVFQELRTGKSPEEKAQIDIGTTFRDVFTAALDPLAVRTARHSALSTFLLPADNGINVLRLCLAAAHLGDANFAPFLVGNKMQRLELAVWLTTFSGPSLAQLVCQPDASGMSTLHAAALLLQGITPQRQLTAAELRSKRVKYYPSLELHLLDSIYSSLSSEQTAAAVSLLCQQDVRGMPTLPRTGWTPLHAAIAADNNDLVQSLLSHGANIAQAGSAYVHFVASSNAGPAVAAAIVAAAAQSVHYNALLNTSSASGNAECEIVARPLHIAARRGNAAALSALVACVKCDLNSRDEHTGTTAIHDIVERSDLSALDAIACAADRIDLLVESPDGSGTCVDIAVAGKDVPMLERLLSMRRNDVVERVLAVRCSGSGSGSGDSYGESLLAAAEKENMQLAIQCGFGPTSAAAPAPAVLASAENMTAVGPEGEVEESKGGEAEDSGKVMVEVSLVGGVEEGKDLEGEREGAGEGEGDAGQEEETELDTSLHQAEGQGEEESKFADALPESSKASLTSPPCTAALMEQTQVKVVPNAHDLKLLQESDDVVRVLIGAVAGVVGADAHAHPCFYRGTLYREVSDSWE